MRLLTSHDLPTPLVEFSQRVKKLNTYAALMAGVFTLLLCHANPALAVSDDSWSARVGFEFAHGDYSTDQATDTYRLPLTLEYSFTEELNVLIDIPKAARLRIPVPAHCPTDSPGRHHRHSLKYLFYISINHDLCLPTNIGY